MNEQLDAVCTAVLFTVPREVASKLEGFLRANGIACRIRRNEMTPEQVAAEMLRQTQPGAARVLDKPFVGRMMRSRLRKDLKAEISVTGSTVPAMYDVLVRPEDLPASQQVPSAEPGVAAVAAASPPSGPTSVLCERPWDRAWELVSRLGDEGIQAAILPNDESTTAPSIHEGMFRIGVRAEDLERAQAMIEA